MIGYMRVSWYENAGLLKAQFSINTEVNENGEEWIYALCDYMKHIDLLKCGDTMYAQMNRDNKNAKGVIIRIRQLPERKKISKMNEFITAKEANNIASSLNENKLNLLNNLILDASNKGLFCIKVKYLSLNTHLYLSKQGYEIINDGNKKHSIISWK